MTDFIFCLIFLQVGIFLISGIALLASVIFLGHEENCGLVAAEVGRHTGPREGALTRSEIEYFMSDDPR